MSKLKQIYERDLNLWREQIAIAIKNKDYESIDWDDLLEEIEDMGKSEQRALKSYTRRLIQHILKIKYWESERDRNKKHWEIEIKNFRQEIKEVLENAPSLKKYLAENYTDWYQKTVTEIRASFAISDNNFVPLET